jgi:hypothetical protein
LLLNKITATVTSSLALAEQSGVPEHLREETRRQCWQLLQDGYKMLQAEHAALRRRQET